MFGVLNVGVSAYVGACAKVGCIWVFLGLELKTRFGVNLQDMHMFLSSAQ